MIWFTADEHYNHFNIIRYCNRPFKDVREMNETLIRKHNEVVTDDDTIYHLGDFIMGTLEDANEIRWRLNGTHIFIRGSHDKWLEPYYPRLIELYVDGDTNRNIPNTTIPNTITLCHYAMRTWSKSHYGSIQLYGHSHGRLEPVGRQMDVGVDCWNFYPVSLISVIDKMKETRPFDSELNCHGEKERI